MKAHSKSLFALLLLVGLSVMAPLLAGCQSAEEKTDPNYYNGKDFNGKSTGAAAGAPSKNKGD